MFDVKRTKQETVYAELKHVQNMLAVGDINDYEMQDCSEFLLYQACSLGLIDVLQSLLLHHDVLSKIDYFPSSIDCSRLLYDCLAIAHEEKHEEVIRFLLEFAVSKKTNTTSRRTQELLEELILLHCAAANGDVEMAAVLIDSGVDVNKTNSEGETALHFACNAATAEFLLNNGANMDAMNVRNETPLYFACVTYRIGIIRKLLDKGANPYLGLTYDLLGIAPESASDADIASALMCCHNSKTSDIPVSCIWSSEHDRDGSQWCISCKEENQLMIQKIMISSFKPYDNSDISEKHYANLNSAFQNYYNSKAESHVADMSEIKRILSISNSVNINTLDTFGTTFLHHAVERNDIEIAKLLLDSGADPNLTSSKKYPLTVACRYLSHEFVRLLLDEGANPNVSDSFDNSPLFIAAASCDHLLVKLLIEHGADVNHRDRKGRTAFHPIVDLSDMRSCTSSGIGSIASAKCLLDHGFNVKQIMVGAEREPVVYYAGRGMHHPYRNTQFARKSVRYKLFEMLLERGADENIINVSCDLRRANNYSFLFREILRHGADTNLPDKQGVNLLSRACMKLCTYHDRILLAPAANPKKVAWDTLVRNTADYSNELIDLLLDSGAKFNDPNDEQGLYNREFQPPCPITL